MEHRQTINPTILPNSDLSSQKVLRTSSGNIQTFALENNDGNENQTPHTNNELLVLRRPHVDLQLLIPKLKLGSNDQHAQNLSRLESRRLHKQARGSQRIAPTRPYLLHPRYIQYRARPRRDTGKDGKAVWDDRLENAFQNALLNIEPLGRKKKSQRGKPHGRNELISEWILQETGEHRDRKQISSHIQTLNGWLRGIPEWDAVIRADKETLVDKPCHEYYADSIEQLVRHRKGVLSSSKYDLESNRTTQNSDSNFTFDGEAEKNIITKISFDMWVSLPNQMDQALHNYTRSESDHSITQPIPLEDVPNWRTSFPDLHTIMESSDPVTNCDIILMEATFQLMPDFPPKLSKLGISLELDFLHPTCDLERLRRLKDWSSMTLMYLHGRQVKGAAYDNCHVAGDGKIKPFFESKWWASTFTQLTEKKKVAEDSERNDKIGMVNDSIKKFFLGLTVMQEISATLCGGNIWEEGAQPLNLSDSKRMAIILWRFSEAEDGSAGRTKWRKLILPPDRTVVNSPPPGSSDIDLPPFAMDTLMESHEDDLFEHSRLFNHHHDQLPTDTEETLIQDFRQDGFMDFNHEAMSSFDIMQSSLEMPMSHDRLLSAPDENLHFDSVPSAFDQLQVNYESTLIETTQNEMAEDQHAKYLMHLQHNAVDVGEHMHRHPLATFNVNTHKRLQLGLATDEALETEKLTQLAKSRMQQNDNLLSGQDHGDGMALKAAFMAVPIMNDLDRHLRYAQTPPPVYMSGSQPLSSTVVRPSLQAHHSFPGIGTSDPQVYQDIKEEFEHTLANLQAHRENRTLSIPNLDDAEDNPKRYSIYEAQSRPQSQPAMLTGHDGDSQQTFPLP